MQHVDHAPGHIAEKIWIARKEDRSHTRHHQDAGDDRREASYDDGAVVELVLERVFSEFSWQRRRPSHKTQESVVSVRYIDSVGPDRPEVQPERRMKDVKENRHGQYGARDPVVGHPGELDANLRKEGSEQQREHRHGHNPMEHTRGLRMPRHTFWYL